MDTSMLTCASLRHSTDLPISFQDHIPDWVVSAVTFSTIPPDLSLLSLPQSCSSPFSSPWCLCRDASATPAEVSAELTCISAVYLASQIPRHNLQTHRHCTQVNWPESGQCELEANLATIDQSHYWLPAWTELLQLCCSLNAIFRAHPCSGE